MFKLKDINDYANWASHKIINLIIKYASEKDVEMLIANCFETVKLSPYEMCQHIDSDMSFSEYLTHLLIYENYPDAELEKKSPTFKADKILLQQALITHLNCILSCFNSYNFLIDIEKKEPKMECPLLTVEYKQTSGDKKKVSFDINSAYNANPLKDSDITNILHKIISSYKNNFYYMFIDDIVYKIEIEVEVEHEKDETITKEVINKVTEYKLLNNKRSPSIVDNKTGLKISISRQIKTLFQFKDEPARMLVNSYESFMGTHERLIKALSFVPSGCHWCSPDENKKNEKIKCDNCRNLLDDLNSFVQCNFDCNAEKIDFNRLITSIKLSDVKNLAELRQQRKELLYSYLNNLKKSTENNTSVDINNSISNLKKLIDKSFSQSVKPD